MDRLKSGRYRAPPVRRHFIDKSDGGKRALGIPSFEDKVAQRAIVMLLEPIYEQDFRDCSFGFRAGRNAHQALRVIRHGVLGQGARWVLEVDVRKYFDSIDHAKLRELLARRVTDGAVRKMIDKWLKAGVLESGQVSFPGVGTPQGGVITPRTQKRTSSSNASYAAGEAGRCLICASRSNMFMSHDPGHSSGQGTASERRISTSRTQDRAVGGGARSIARVWPLTPSGISVPRGSRPFGAASRSGRVHSAHHIEAHAEHRAGIARVCEQQRPHDRIDRHARSGRLSHICQAAWLSGAPPRAHTKFISTMPLTDCATRSSHRSTTSWFRRASATLADG